MNIQINGISHDQFFSCLRAIIKEELQTKNVGTTLQPKIISEKELCGYLDISQPTAQKWRDKGKIPFMRIGSAIRYDLLKVLAALEKKNS